MKEFVAALRELADTGERASPALVRIAADVIEEQARDIDSLRIERDAARAIAEANEGIIAERDAAREQLSRSTRAQIVREREVVAAIDNLRAERDAVRSQLTQSAKLTAQASQTICTREGGCVCVISLDPGPCDYMR